MLKYGRFLAILLFVLMSGCAAQIAEKPVFSTSTATLNPGESERAVRVVFHKDNFTDINDFNPVAGPTPTNSNTQYKCLGDATKVYYANGDDYSGSPTAFPSSSTPDFFTPTYRPIFLKNVSVDMTNAYYQLTQADTLLSDVCSYRAVANTNVPWSCADFDRVPAAVPYPLVTPTPTPIPTPTTNEFYNSGFYRVRDDFCAYQGPQTSPDVEVTKSLVGGVNIDIDRYKMGANEDLLMVVTYHAMGEYDHALSWPATLAIYMKEIATLEDPFGGLRSEQVYIPLSQNLLVDRIRIERNRGSFHLFQVDLYRLGNRGQ